MSWTDDLGRHEGYVVCVFADGRIGGGIGPGGIPVYGDDGTGGLDGAGNPLLTRPAAAVCGWRVACDHVPAGVPDERLADWFGRREFWTGPTLWQRVYTRAEEDLSQARICVPLDDRDVWIDDRPDVAELVVQEWSTHVVPDEHGRSIRRALAAVADAARTVDLEVAAARAAGLSWADIGAAAGITRQAAHDRWGPTSRHVT